jgi:hypothetical protein
VTKIKNCSGSIKVDQILKVWSLLSPKIIISSKSVELKMCMAQNPVAPPINTDTPLKNVSKAKFIENLEFFRKLAS